MGVLTQSDTGAAIDALGTVFEIAPRDAGIVTIALTGSAGAGYELQVKDDDGTNWETYNTWGDTTTSIQFTDTIAADRIRLQVVTAATAGATADYVAGAERN